jgi:hypothetical protein
MKNGAIAWLAVACLLFGALLSGVGANCDASIVYPTAPDADGARQVILDMLRQDDYLAATFVKGINLDDLTIGTPFRDYTVRMNDVAAGRMLAAATLGRNWLYPVMHGTTVVAVAWVRPPKRAGLEEQPLAIETQNALRVAEQLPQVKDHDYEFRHLSVPQFFEAVWLHSGSDDILIPLRNGPLKSCQPYSEGQVTEALKQEVANGGEGGGVEGCDSD